VWRCRAPGPGLSVASDRQSASNDAVDAQVRARASLAGMRVGEDGLCRSCSSDESGCQSVDQTQQSQTCPKGRLHADAGKAAADFNEFGRRTVSFGLERHDRNTYVIQVQWSREPRSNESEKELMPHELKRPYKFGGAALVASGILFVSVAFLDLRAGRPPSNGAEILVWRDSQALTLDFVSEFLFFATVLLIPGTIAVYQSLLDVDRIKAATGCGIIAATIPVVAVMLVVHGRLVYPIYGMRVDTPDAAALVVMIFYGGLHAIYLLLAVATILLSLAMKRGGYAKWIAYFGFATAVLDIVGSYPWAVGPVLTLVCQLALAGWFVAVGSELFRMRAAPGDAT